MRSFILHITIEPVVFLYVLAVFAEYDVIGDIFYVNKCIHHLKLNQSDQLRQCTEDIKHNKSSESNFISSETNKALLIYNGILYFSSIVSSLIAATYADRKSKFWPILMPIIGSAIVQLSILFSLNIKCSESNFFCLLSPNGIYILYICSFVSGITGGTSTLLSTCFAFVAEKCSPSQRTSRITIIEACLFSGGFFGFTVAGAILRSNSNSLSRYNWNFSLFLAIHLLLTFYISFRQKIFFNDPNFAQQVSERFSILTSAIQTIFRRRPYRYQRKLMHLILIAFTLISFWNVAITTLLFTYTRNLLKWPTWKYSYFSSAKFGFCGLCLCILPVIKNYFFQSSIDDSTIITLGLLSRSLSAILIGLATINENLMFFALAAITLAEYPIPAIRSMISKIVDTNERAKVFAIMGAIQSICFFTGGVFFLAIYNSILGSQISTTFKTPGLIFIVMGLFQLISLSILCYAKTLIKKFNILRSLPTDDPSTQVFRQDE